MLTPFAVGSAVAAPIAGNLVSRLHRRITVLALVVLMAGMLAVAVLVPLGDSSNQLWLIIAGPLLLAGLGGGAVVSPNYTLSLEKVPPRMGGAAGAALQTGQRVGSAIGAALLMTVYQHGLRLSGDPGSALHFALAAALLILSIALAMAVYALRTGRQGEGLNRGRSGQWGQWGR